MSSTADAHSLGNASETRPNAVAIGFSCRAIAESLMQTRRRVAVIDCCGDLDTELCSDWVFSVSSLTNTAEVIEILTNLFGTFGPLPILLGSGTENVPELLARIEVAWPGSIAEADWQGLRDWKNWERWGKESGFPFPVTFDRDTPDAQGVYQVQDAQDWLLKRTRSAGGLGVQVLANSDSLDVFNLAKIPEHTILQRRLKGRTLGVHFFSTPKKSQVLGVVEALSFGDHPSGAFVYSGSMGPVFLRAIEVLLLENFANIVVRNSGLQGTWNADFVATEQGWHLIEVNPRWSAGMEVLELCAPPIIVPEAALNDNFGATPGTDEKLKQINAPKFALKRILYAAGDFEISQEQVQELVNRSSYGPGWRLNMEALGSESQVSESQAREHEGLSKVRSSAAVRVADIPSPRTLFSRGMPVCTVLVTADSEKEACGVVQAAVRDLQEVLTSIT